MTGQALANINRLRAFDGRSSAEAARALGLCEPYVERLAKANGIALFKNSSTQRVYVSTKASSCLARHGCTWDQYAPLRGIVTLRYIEQRRNAKARGIAWEFDFWQWWQVWHRSGKWELRGRGQGYVMSRKGDDGPYRADNVFIALATDNSSQRRCKRWDLPKGVWRKRNGTFSARRVYGGVDYNLGGSFLTPQSAHNAYLEFSLDKARARDEAPPLLHARKTITLPDRPFDWKTWVRPERAA